MSDGRTMPPWTQEQCAKLNEFQACGYVHPFTCRNDHDGSRELVAGEDGWACPTCDYVQMWAHTFMLDGAPPNPFDTVRAIASKGEAEHMHCAAGCEKAQAETVNGHLVCARCGTDFVPCTQETCG